MALIGLALTSVIFNILVSFDWAAPGAFLLIEAIRRGFFVVGLLGGLLLAALRPGGEWKLDDRAAPWILNAIRLALGVFLLHNLIEFSLFEPNTTCLFALLVGAVLGARTAPRVGADEAAADRPGHPWRTVGARVALGVALLAWLAVALGLALPVATAEASAADGEVHLRAASAAGEETASRPGASAAVRRGAFSAAASEAAEAGKDFEAAWRQVPYNADYAFRAAQAWDVAGRPDRAGPLLDAAVAADPSAAVYRVGRAEHELDVGTQGTQGSKGTQGTTPPPEAVRWRVEADFAAALALDPANVALRLKFAEALEEFGENEQAAEQYEQAVCYNDQLSREENKRLPDERVEELRGKVRALRGK